ncbi:MAG: DsbA family protein [Nitrospirales bacterium]|nr:DsbA family protein [Nitrospira sp.]MDR4500561.1 DsbA family protein [Nitrospirales bacterium]
MPIQQTINERWGGKRVFVVTLCVLVLSVVSLVSAEPSTDFLVRDSDFVRGNPNAPVTVLEYSDFTCGFCEKFFHDTFPRLLSEYVDTGKVRFVYRDFPRSPGGPGLRASMAARCAGEQGSYWPMHDLLFNSDQQFSVEQLRGYAKKLGLDDMKFSECLLSEKYVKEIYQDRIEGGTLGVRGTPGFVIFITSLPEDGEMVMIPGAFPYDVFQKEIEKVLKAVPADQTLEHPSTSAIPVPQGQGIDS